MKQFLDREIVGKCQKLSGRIIFKDQDNRRKYEKHLENISELKTLLDSVNKRSSNYFRSNDIARNYIHNVYELYNDYVASILIYNYIIHNYDEPLYIPTEFTVYCPHCANKNKFFDEKDAQRVNRCTFCTKTIYKICNNCGRISLDNNAPCLCNIIKQKSVQLQKLLDDIYEGFKSGMSPSKIEDILTYTQNYMSSNRTIDFPSISENSKIDKIADYSKVYKRYYDEISNLIRNKDYCLAVKKLKEYKAFATGRLFGFESLESSITSVLNDCETEYSNSLKLKKAERINVCLNILKKCKDFEKAIAFLNNNPPSKPHNVTFVNDSGTLTLKWEKVNDNDVTYMVIRKEGAYPPISPLDGTMICHKLQVTYAVDFVPDICKVYTYGVFTTRGSSTSNDCSFVVFKPAAVNDVTVAQENERLIIKWKLPDKCIGANYAIFSKRAFKTGNAIGNTLDIKLEKRELGDEIEITLFSLYPNDVLGESVSVKYKSHIMLDLDADKSYILEKESGFRAVLYLNNFELKNRSEVVGFFVVLRTPLSKGSKYANGLEFNENEFKYVPVLDYATSGNRIVVNYPREYDQSFSKCYLFYVSLFIAYLNGENTSMMYTPYKAEIKKRPRILVYWSIKKGIQKPTLRIRVKSTQSLTSFPSMTIRFSKDSQIATPTSGRFFASINSLELDDDTKEFEYSWKLNTAYSDKGFEKSDNLFLFLNIRDKDYAESFEIHKDNGFSGKLV